MIFIMAVSGLLKSDLSKHIIKIGLLGLPVDQRILASMSVDKLGPGAGAGLIAAQPPVQGNNND